MFVSNDNSYDLYLEGQQLLESKNFDEAIRKFEESIKSMPHFKTYELLGECFFDAQSD